MHGFSLGSTLLLNAEVDSMGGVIDGGVGIGTKTSPREAAIEKVQSDIRLNYGVREERRRELEFLEKGGNLLDFNFGTAASLSAQSTSFSEHIQGKFVTSEAKDSIALAVSPRGDSVESSGRLGTAVACEPNSADNFDGENEILESDRNSKFSRSRITPSEHYSQVDGSQNVQPKKAYKRRYRPKPNNDTARSSSTDVTSRGGNGSYPPLSHSVIQKPVMHVNPVHAEASVANATVNSPTNGGLTEGNFDVSSSKDMNDDLNNQNLKAVDGPVTVTSAALDSVGGREQAVLIKSECPCSVVETSEKHTDHEHMSESNQFKGDEKWLQTEGVTSNPASNLKSLDSESSCTQTSLSINANGNNDSDLYTTLKNEDFTGEPREETVTASQPANRKDDEVLEERKLTDTDKSNAFSNDACFSQIHQTNGFVDKTEEVMNENSLSSQNEDKGPTNAQELQADDCIELATESKKNTPDDPDPEVKICMEDLPGPQDPSVPELTNTDSSAKTMAPEDEPFGNSQARAVDKEQEDLILEEAQIIEVKRKRISELSSVSQPNEYHCKSHWDFVLEEMAWLANDFAQERIWKMTAAGQLCQQATFASHLRSEKSCKYGKQKFIACTLSKAVMDFWYSAGLLLEQIGCDMENHEHGTLASRNTDENRNNEHENEGHDKDKQHHGNAIQRYAVRFLQHNSSLMPLTRVGYVGPPEDSTKTDLPEVACQDQFVEETLFYAVPHGAMQAYRKYIERFLVQSEESIKSMQEEVDTSMHEAALEFGFQENEYEEDEGENMDYLPGAFERSNSIKFVQKKRKMTKAHSSRSYDVGGNFFSSYGIDSKASTLQSTLVAKRLSNGLNVGPIPTKRVRTASRQRIIGPFSGGTAGMKLAPTRADASSGDTNSFQDDLISLHGGSIIPKGSEAESEMEFDKQSTYDTPEISAKPKKKKKTKHQGMPYDQRWQFDSSMQSEQKDNLKKRSENHHCDFNGSSGQFGPHVKKPKLMKQSLDSSYENATHMSASIASPVASQMSNMSNPSKLMKLIGGRDRSRKAKGLKIAPGQAGSGSTWSLFEDQALVVLVHDMGTNWELVSDAINSTLQFKRLFRKPKECKERHKALMDMNSGDGADSAEDSGSSQPYPSTLPGIPKGSARQLFQQLRGPMEEDTIRSHFEKIILIGQRLHSRKKQESKQLATVHASHAAAIMQELPNNVNGSVLTPLDLCDTDVFSPDVFSLGYQGPHTGGSLANQGLVQPMFPSSGPIPSHQGSPGISMGATLASSSTQVNGPGRDRRYAASRAGMGMDEHQRIQQYNNMLSGRNMQQSNMSVPGTFLGNDPHPSVRMSPGVAGVSMMPGMNRSQPMPPRPGIQGIPSPSLMNSGSTGASNLTGIPSNMNMTSGANHGQGNSVLRPRGALNMAQSTEHPRQMTSAEMQMQASQANNQGGVSPFGGLNSSFPGQSHSSSVPQYPVPHQQHHQIAQQSSNLSSNSHHPLMQGSSHAPTPEQRAFAMRLARDRQLQQRILQKQQQQQQRPQQQQFPTTNALMSHPLSAPSLPNGPHIQPQASSQSVSLPPSTSPSSPMTTVVSQQKHPYPQNGLGRTSQSGAGSGMNQGIMGKQQRQRQAQQLLQQAGRQHPQQRQPSHQQSQHQAKLMKGMGRGSNVSMHQNLPMDPSHLNSLSGNTSGGQVMEKGEQSMHLSQHHSYSMQPSKITIPPSQSGQSPQQKKFSSSVPTSSKQAQQTASHPDGSSQSHSPAVPPAPAIPTSNQGLSSMTVPSFNNVQQMKAHPQAATKLVNHSQPSVQREAPQNRVQNSDMLAKHRADQGRVENLLAINSCTSTSITGSQPASIEPVNSGLACDPMMRNMSSSQLGPIKNPALTKSSGNELHGSDGLVVGSRHVSNSLSSLGHGCGAQWTEQQASNQSLMSLKHNQQQQLEQLPQKQTPLKQQPQPHIQVAPSNNFSGSNSDLK